MNSRSALTIAMMLFAVHSGQAEVIVVHPGPGTPVQDAIDSANAGDEVVLMPGEYTETIDYLGKAITIRSDAGPGVTVLDAGGLGPAVRFVTGEGAGSVLEGLALTGGVGEFRGQLRVGGAVYIDGASPTLIDCVFQGNTADVGGAVAVLAEGAPLVRGCSFQSNTADQGGAVYVLDASPGLLQCVFHANGAEFRGGAMLIDGDAAPQIVNTRFHGSNAAKLDGGAIACLRDAAPTLINVVLTGNAAECGGGGVYAFHGSSPVIAHATLVGNAGTTGPGFLAEASSQGTVVNSIFAGGATDLIAGTGLTVNYSLVQGGWSGGGAGNISLPPRLLDPVGPDNLLGTPDDDVRLASGSPAIDAASGALLPADSLDADANGDVSEPISVDLALAARAIDALAYADAGVPAANGAVPDMGAYEAAADVLPFCLCEVDGAAGIDVMDLLAYLDLWFEGAEAAELTGDQPAVVDVFDLLVFLNCWFVGCG